MENNLNVSLQGFSNENAAKEIGNFTLQMIKTLEQHYQLNISKLRQIVISYDFSSALENVSNEYGHKSPSTFTNNNQVRAVAKLLSKLTNDGHYSEYTLVLCINFFNDLFNEDGSISFDDIGNIMHTMHHELIHIHENNNNSLDSTKIVDAYDDAILMTSTRSWSEFLANYMSAPSATLELVETTLTTLETVLIETPKEIKYLVFKYKTRQLQLDEMFFAVKEKIKLIANMYGYSIGYIEAIPVNIESHFPSLFNLLTSSTLAVPLKELNQSFMQIKAKYDDNGLCDYDIFEPANTAIHNIYKSFGLKLEKQSDPSKGVYIHVY